METAIGIRDWLTIASLLRAYEWNNDGGREGIRTLDLSVANAALSQLSYAPDSQRGQSRSTHPFFIDEV
jgi:hypothetical protein